MRVYQAVADVRDMDTLAVVNDMKIRDDRTSVADAAAATYFPVSVVANAAHSRRPVRLMTLQPLAPHSLSATSSARDWDSWFQLQPRFPVSLSQAIAPYSARAGRVVSRTDAKPNRAARARGARRIDLFSSC
jgi:hypothetical protein